MDDTEQPSRVLVVGAGTMGHSIAQVFAQAGLTVDLADTNAEVLERAVRGIEANLSTITESKHSSEAETRTYVENVLKLVKPTTDLIGVTNEAEIVFEAVYESVEAKQEVFNLLEEHIPNETIIASNTSALNLFDETKLSHPERLICAHWFAPAHIVPLVEVAGGPATAEHVVTRTVAFLESVGKRPLIMRKFVPGFIANRIMMAMADAAEELLDSGAATPEEIDYAVKTSVGVRLGVVGIFQSLDFNGLDLIAGDRTLDELPAYLRAKIENGDLGVKTGRGFYEYEKDSPLETLKRRDRSYLAALWALEESCDFQPIH